MKTAWAFLLLLAGAVGQSVKYSLPVCAVRGSTVTLPCTFTPIKEIIRVVWCQNHLICHGSTPSVYDSDSKTNKPPDPRYRYLGDKTGNCTLQISNLQERDKATFRFRMEAKEAAGHHTGQSGVNVTVVDGSPMRITSSSEREVREGQNVTLLCTSTCTFHQLQVTWFRGDHLLPGSGPALRFSPLTAEDSGNYTCGLKANWGTRSVAYVLQVEAADGGPTLDYLTIVRLLLVTALTVLIIIVASIVIKRTCVCRRAEQQRDE
ncbi:B-cell receptor CD22-like [Seriola dumerili]|uniref:B-cell receptor CD22-like n=1 Tax=Seriola dumerili TaxID=41447 RepID=UPI000BBF3660|nr:B-cell receptor CD22-like [Seriola dumerili]